MTEAERAREWLRFASDDLRAAEVLLREGIFNEVCFHAQQCAEKMLKALLTSQKKLVPKTHRLTDLLEEVLKKDFRFENIRDACLILDQYYIPTRYPDAVIGSKPAGLPSRKDAEEAFDLAQTIAATLRPLLSDG